ncbi:MAG: ATP-binding protein [Albidovulum sp.]|uniref:ATP-binding protein n=1 Tax=Albidovulum sp. TaxID=1872424 RepID=UPI003CA19134
MQLDAMRTVLDALPIAVAFVDADERVRIANRACAAILGPAPEGRTCSALLRHPEFLGGLEASLSGDKTHVKRLILTAGGNETHLTVTFTPMITTTVKGVLVAFEDLTPIEQAGVMRRDFVANVSHELRTPLTALVGFIETLRGAARDDPAARDRFLGIMEREAGRMIRLVSDLLSLSRVEAEERRRPANEVDIAVLLKTLLESHRETAASGGIDLRLEMAEGPVRLRADGDQLTQVFHNLVENAIKYGGGGKEVMIRVTELQHEPVLKGAAIQVEVIDRGEGIGPLHLPRLTERFYRVDTHRSREQGGTGLGLAIVKHIVNRHRGRLKIESEPGKGSKFIIILPKT